jgi:hypothetical protein
MNDNDWYEWKETCTYSSPLDYECAARQCHDLWVEKFWHSVESGQRLVLLFNRYDRLSRLPSLDCRTQRLIRNRHLLKPRRVRSN